MGLMMMAVASLSACNRNSESDVIANDPFAAGSTAKGDQFGKVFGEASRASPNSEPANIVEGDLPPVSMTAEPLPLD